MLRDHQWDGARYREEVAAGATVADVLCLEIARRSQTIGRVRCDHDGADQVLTGVERVEGTP